MTDLELYCEQCGGRLTRLWDSGDISPTYQCRLCNEKGTLGLDPDGGLTACSGPALDPNYNTHQYIADGGTSRENQHTKNVLKQLRQAERETRESGDDELADRLGTRYDELSEECISELRELDEELPDTRGGDA